VRIVVDSNVLVALAVPTDYSTPALEKVTAWLAQETSLFAPALWSYEAVSAIRKFVAAGQLGGAEAAAAVAQILELGIQEVNASEELHRQALKWAERLGDLVAYDPAYLAVAESLGAPFWTADGRLVRKVRALGVDWIHEISEPVPAETEGRKP